MESVTLKTVRGNRRLPHVGRWLSAVLALLLLLSVMGLPRVAKAVDYSYIYWGIAATVNCSSWSGDQHQISGWPSCWHVDESSTDYYGNSAWYSAIDYTKSGGGTSGTLVQLWYTGVTIRPYFRAVSSGYCTGVEVDTHDASNNFLGDIHYKHIDVYSGVVGSSSQSYDGGHYYRDLGTVSSSQPEGCPWTGAHLHQSANAAGWTSIYSNSSVNPTSTYEHSVQQ